jgi:flagellar motor protein MotB
VNGDRRARWAISFADLALLLLGFFVILQASGGRSKAVLQGVAEQFGGHVSTGNEAVALWKAKDLFVPGEAILTAAGTARISAESARFRSIPGGVELTSVGMDGGARRFDSWDLAAARLGAVARALRSTGMADGRLVIRGLDETAKDAQGQTIRIAATPPATH